MSEPTPGVRRRRRERPLPLRLKLQPEEGGPSHEQVLRQPFRLGFGQDCDIQLVGGKGPDVLFEVERFRGPLLIATALPPEECAHYVDLKINGEPLRQPMQELSPGSRLDILDKATHRRYRVLVDPGAGQRWLRPRNLALVMAVLVVVGGAFGGYLYWSLRGTQTEVARTAQRMEEAEVALERTARELLESVGRMGTTDAELARGIRELGSLQASTSREIRDEFTRRIIELDAQTREAVARAAAADTTQRRKLAETAQARLEELRAEFSARMVASYQQMKDLERTLRDSMAERFAAREPAPAPMKQVLAAAREAVLFIRTRYRVRFGSAEEPRELTSLGTGFLAGPGGLAVSAQHVMFPWRFDEELLVLQSLGLVELVPDSVRWSVWPAGSRVLRDPADVESFDESGALRSGGPEPGMRMLLAPAPRLTPSVVSSPIGVVELPVPVPGPGDVAVFQIARFDGPLPHLRPRADPAAVEALDEVLVVGYPYSRLQDGLAWPQGVRGFVRRVGEELLEIDAAVHPGLSGGPILAASGELLGMVSAFIGSEVYGAAVRGEDLGLALGEAREAVRREESRLKALGCDPGTVDGVFDAATWQAYRCEERAAR